MFIFSTFDYECSKAHGHNRHMDLEAVLRRTNSHCGTSDLWIHVTSSQSILRIQNFKIGQRENFEEKKAPFLKYRDETIDKHFRVAIFTTNSGYIIYLGLHFVYLGIFVMKSGFRFSCWAPEMPFSRLSKRPFPLNPLFGQFWYFGFSVSIFFKVLIFYVYPKIQSPTMGLCFLTWLRGSSVGGLHFSVKMSSEYPTKCAFLHSFTLMFCFF